MKVTNNPKKINTHEETKPENKPKEIPKLCMWVKSKKNVIFLKVFKSIDLKISCFTKKSKKIKKNNNKNLYTKT